MKTILFLAVSMMALAAPAAVPVARCASAAETYEFYGPYRADAFVLMTDASTGRRVKFPARLEFGNWDSYLARLTVGGRAVEIEFSNGISPSDGELRINGRATPLRCELVPARRF